ncbi:RNA-directed DNA polymerase [Lysobacter sp. Root494]|uniref:RNA-directed DNA polymerase n=1 Tax=Lysobacter sp. Root494 TaxID=1736549 RepID=UPI000AE9131B|nr:RNA-directed DNA polymerase [Lysobacter sp. Root494]
MFGKEDLYRAYRKAKHEAFFDGTQPSLLSFVEYEANLDQNLERLGRILANKAKPWYRRPEIVCGFTYLPKSLSAVNAEAGEIAHFSTGDQVRDWTSKFHRAGVRANAEFRLVIVPSIEFQIISALWVMHVGRVYDAALSDRCVYGNRPRKAVRDEEGGIVIEDDSFALFKPYFSGYREWRENGLRAMRGAIEGGDSIIAVTMDAQRYYHSISPRFLLSRSFLAASGVVLSEEKLRFTAEMVDALEFWYAGTPDSDGSSIGAVPVGLSASKIIANVLLVEFDRAVNERLDCIYYGRYVDDVFLVVRGEGLSNAEEVIRWMRERLDGYVVLDRAKGESTGLRVTLPYLEGSRVVFAGSKQKIFLLSGHHGADLVRQISEHIRQASSEYRLVPSLGEVNKVLTSALLATDDAAIEADALRKAEAMSIRRHGLSIATRNLEGYARDVLPIEWEEKRKEAYGLVLRHVITPIGLFNYWRYIARVFGVMVACGDWSSATKLLDRVNEVFLAVRDGIDKASSEKLASMADVYRRSFLETAVSASTVAGFTFPKSFRKLLRRLDPSSTYFRISEITTSAAKEKSSRMLLSDLGRRPYKDYWYNENPKSRSPRPIPEVRFVRQMVELVSGLKRHLVRSLNDPHWPAIAFATRPPTLPEIGLMMPALLEESGGVAKALLAIRGAGVPTSSRGLRIARAKKRFFDHHVPFRRKPGAISVAVSSFLTTRSQWDQALVGTPDLSIDRYERLITLVNSIIRQAPEVNYIALPESSIPFHWAFSIAKNLSKVGISLICGLETAPKAGRYRNDALVSLVTNFGGYQASLIFRQPKMALAHREAEDVEKAKLHYREPKAPRGRPLYVHGDFLFSVLLCSDLTNINHRRALQGQIDGLFVLEWNPDVDTFSYLVESASHDLHAPVVQINNREYGDSRIRAPYKVDYERDVVRIKGGDRDFFVVASFDHLALRDFQEHGTNAGKYKPLPIGYLMAPRRKRGAETS